MTMDDCSEDSVSLAAEKANTRHVAVVGTGMAGLVTAYLLQRDPLNRFNVEIFESGSSLSLAASSVTAVDKTSGQQVTVDVPMRAFTGAYYKNMIAMYDALGIQYQQQKFRFGFVKDEEADEKAVQNNHTYFIHSSDNHRSLPSRPESIPLLAYWLEFSYIVLCFFWFMVACSIVPASGSDETLERWLQRTRLPHRFIYYYLLPLFSAMATCSHQQLLQFPASDIVRYRQSIRTQNHYVVTGGVKNAENILAADLRVYTRSRISCVRSRGDKVEVSVQSQGQDGQITAETREFDQVVLAMSPDVVAKVYEPTRDQLEQIPVRSVDTVVQSMDIDNSNAKFVDEVLLKTHGSVEESTVATEATHVHPSGIAVTSCARSEAASGNVISRTQFKRALRTPHSRKIVQDIFEEEQLEVATGHDMKRWRNGDNGVWLVGAWCWDGIPLLEGAVVSAARVARAFGVEVPWERNDGKP